MSFDVNNTNNEEFLHDHYSMRYTDYIETDASSCWSTIYPLDQPSGIQRVEASHDVIATRGQSETSTRPEPEVSHQQPATFIASRDQESTQYLWSSRTSPTAHSIQRQRALSKDGGGNNNTAYSSLEVPIALSVRAKRQRSTGQHGASPRWRTHIHPLTLWLIY